MPRSLGRTLRALWLALVVSAFLGASPSPRAPPPPPPPPASTAGDAPTDVLFILDSSASMSRDDARGKASDPERLRLSALRAFVTLATPRMRLGLVNLSAGD